MDKRDSRRLDLTGRRFGRITVIGYSHTCEQGRIYWLCRWNCGKYIVVRSSSLKNGITNSCGYKWKETIKSRQAYLNNA